MSILPNHNAAFTKCERWYYELTDHTELGVYLFDDPVSGAIDLVLTAIGRFGPLDPDSVHDMKFLVQVSGEQVIPWFNATEGVFVMTGFDDDDQAFEWARTASEWLSVRPEDEQLAS